MRKNTLKRQSLNRAAAKLREQLIAEVGQCELCNRNFSLACHEISRGSSRAKSLDQRSCILVLCNAPHGIKPSCHSVVGAWPREKQLALLYIRRGMDYDLARYWEIIGRKTPDQADVDGWIDRLTRTK